MSKIIDLFLVVVLVVLIGLVSFDLAKTPSNSLMGELLFPHWANPDEEEEMTIKLVIMEKMSVSPEGAHVIYGLLLENIRTFDLMVDVLGGMTLQQNIMDRKGLAIPIREIIEKDREGLLHIM